MFVIMLSSYGDFGASPIVMIIIILYDNMHHHHFPLKLYWFKLFYMPPIRFGRPGTRSWLSPAIRPGTLPGSVCTRMVAMSLARGFPHPPSSPSMSWTTATKKTLNDLKRQLAPSGLAEVEVGIPMLRRGLSVLLILLAGQCHAAAPDIVTYSATMGANSTSRRYVLCARCAAMPVRRMQPPPALLSTSRTRDALPCLCDGCSHPPCCHQLWQRRQQH